MEEFLKGVKGINSFSLNDHVSIIQINNDNENFQLMAVDDKMRVLWSNTYPGYALSVDRFKGKVVALVSTDHSFFKGANDTYKAYLVDPATGKLIVDKVIYTGPNEYRCFAELSTGNGDYMKLLVRQTGLKRSMKVALPGPFAYFSFKAYRRQNIQTTAMQILDYDEKLNVASTISPIISNGNYIGTSWNKHGDMFISWLNGPNIEISRYDAGKTAPSNQMALDGEFKENKDFDPADLLSFKPSDVDNNVLYYGMFFRSQDKQMVLNIGKFDFATNKKEYSNEVFTKDHLKQIKKNFVPIDKKIDENDAGDARGFGIKYINEIDGKLIVSFAANSQLVSNRGSYFMEATTIINGYDKNLQPKFQVLLPSKSGSPHRTLETGYHFVNNKLHIISNSTEHSNSGLYAVLDVNTGNWDKMAYLSKKHLNKDDFSDGPNILWFKDCFLVPYFDPKGWTQSSYNIALQQNTY
ncbi:hypothetical protein D0C36_17955 [Mucilaginibacter conchicola]|uniref:Uncharacterized protein n=2 Tax=Mucilaginibacter conchicola TaxID=2303333 RepID=A0A372NPG8_9SPHI|nr:hypothetical protein D0C36_17955 [Mucilaginibacter conchicola]